MPRTDFTSGDLTASGTFSIPNPGWGIAQGNCGSIVGNPLDLYWYHPPEHFSRSFSLGPVNVHVGCAQASYVWQNGQWINTYGGPIPGYPEALPAPSRSCGWASVRAIMTYVEAAGVVGQSVWRSGYAIISADEPCSVVPLTNMVIYGQNINSGSIGWSIELAALPLYQSITQVTTTSRAYATCVQQLQNKYWWQSDAWDVRGSCGGASARNEAATWNSVWLPGWSASLTFGAGMEFVRCLSPEPCPPRGQWCMGRAAYRRIADNHETTWSLSSQYPGLRASGSHVRYVDPYYGDNVLTYHFGNGYMQGSVSSHDAPTSCCYPDPVTVVASSEMEYGRASTRIGFDLVAFDQMTALGSSAGLKATVPHFIDDDMVWNEDEQRYVRGATFGQPRILTVPGDYTAYWCHTSRYDDQIAPLDANDVMTVRLTDDSLRALDLPTADNVMPLFDGALNRIGITRSQWGAYDDHGGSYTGLLKVGVQSPLSVQWAQDDRAQPNPPSWWYVLGTNQPLLRANLAAHLSLTQLSGQVSIRRDLWWHPHRRDAEMLIAPLGTLETDLWRYLFAFERATATKHLLAGTEVYGPVPIDKNGKVCEPDDPNYDHMGVGVMPQSEDVTDWRLYRSMRLTVSCDSPQAWQMLVTLEYEHDLISDSWELNTGNRTDAWFVATTLETEVYTATVPAHAVAHDVVIDLFGNAPYLERVRGITISGIPADSATSFSLNGFDLIAPVDHVRLENVDQRPVRYGGEPRYTCGDQQFLGSAQTPEEYGGRWLVGGHTIVRAPREPGRTVGVAPAWGYPFVIRRVTDCGALQDQLKGYGAWYGELAGTWGIEGVYGRDHATAGDPAMDDWTDPNGAVLALNDAAGITHVPILLDYALASSDFLGPGRDQDGPTSVPVVVRAGQVRICEGINHALSGNVTPYWGAKHHLYGSRLAHCYSSGPPYQRAPDGVSCTLYERDETTSTLRLVATHSTDRDGRLRFIRGVREFRHLEYGSEAGSNPDYDLRHDYRSDIIHEGQDTTALAFGLQHYQPIPSWALERARGVDACDIDSDIAGRIWCAIDAGNQIEVYLCDYRMPNTWQFCGVAHSGFELTAPAICSRTDAGEVVVVCTDEVALTTRIAVGRTFAQPGTVAIAWQEVTTTSTIGADLTLADIDYRDGLTVCVGYASGTIWFEWTTRADLQMEPVSGSNLRIAVATADEKRPSVTINDDGSYTVALVSGGVVQHYICRSVDYGFEFVDVVG